MPRNALERIEAIAVPSQERGQIDQQPTQFGVWLTTTGVAAFVPCASVEAARQWIKRHGIRRRNNGTVARRDVERELARRKPRRVMAAASLSNLRNARKAV